MAFFNNIMAFLNRPACRPCLSPTTRLILSYQTSPHRSFAQYLSKYKCAPQNTPSAKLLSTVKNNSYLPAPDCLKTRHNMDGRPQTKLNNHRQTITMPITYYIYISNYQEE